MTIIFVKYSNVKVIQQSIASVRKFDFVRKFYIIPPPFDEKCPTKTSQVNLKERLIDVENSSTVTNWGAEILEF